MIPERIIANCFFLSVSPFSFLSLFFSPLPLSLLLWPEESPWVSRQSRVLAAAQSQLTSDVGDCEERKECSLDSHLLLCNWLAIICCSYWGMIVCLLVFISLNAFLYQLVVNTASLEQECFKYVVHIAAFILSDDGCSKLDNHSFTKNREHFHCWIRDTFLKYTVVCSVLSLALEVTYWQIVFKLTILVHAIALPERES